MSAAAVRTALARWAALAGFTLGRALAAGCAGAGVAFAGLGH
ncbi:hypothetical protein [Sphingorhabdus sp.]